MRSETGSPPAGAPDGLGRGDGRWRPRRGSAPGLAHLLSRGTWHPLGARPDRCAYRVDTPAGPFFAKHYAPGSLAGRWRDFALRRKPQRAFARGLALAEGGVATARPLGLFSRGGPLWHQALLVLEWLDGAEPWERCLSGGAADAPVLEALAATLGGLHRRGLYHGDLPANLVAAGGERGLLRVYVVDLEDLKRGLGRRRRVKNLEELGRRAPGLAVRRQGAFLQAYCREAGLERSAARILWRQCRRRRSRIGRGGR
ncbi:MAG: hypothetical protein Kow0092_01200 [Deferrisomatales bacterium]